MEVCQGIIQVHGSCHIEETELRAVVEGLELYGVEVVVHVFGLSRRLIQKQSLISFNLIKNELEPGGLRGLFCSCPLQIG